jgi:DNA invertase Pin-like site-specific DNA recombinase
MRKAYAISEQVIIGKKPVQWRSGSRSRPAALHEALEQLREDDVLVVWKLDRLSRSLKDMLLILEKVTDAGAGFRSLTEAIDTTTPAGRMMLQMLGAFAEFERSMIRERTRLGLQAARERGRVGGRLPKLTAHQRAEAIKMVESGNKTGAEVARLFRVHRSSISRLISQARIADWQQTGHDILWPFQLHQVAAFGSFEPYLLSIRCSVADHLKQIKSANNDGWLQRSQSRFQPGAMSSHRDLSGIPANWLWWL